MPTCEFHFIQEDTLIGHQVITGKPAISFYFDPENKRKKGIGIVLKDQLDIDGLRAFCDKAEKFFKDKK